MRFAFTILLFIAVFILNFAGASDIENDIKKHLSDLPFKMPSIQLPEFPDKDFIITNFGANGDGHTLNTDAFNKTIKACAGSGGGRVIVPAGMWLTGPIILQSNINLHLERGAAIIFSGNFENYPVIETSWEGLPMKRCTSPIYGKDLENIAITGKGIIDGSGDEWRPVLKWEMTEIQWDELIKSGGVVKPGHGTMVWWPTAKASNGKEIVDSLDMQNAATEEYAKAGKYLRPVLVSLVNCSKVLLDGPTFQNSPAWNIHPLLCRDVVIRNINVKNPWYSTNGDGLDLESCQNVLVYNCNFDVGDDAICLKSGRDEYGRKRGIPSENIVISNCTVHEGHGGFVIGSEMSGGVRNIMVRNCTFLGTDLGLRFKSRRGRGGIVENIFVDNILMKDIKTEAIRLNTYYQNKAPGQTGPFEFSEDEYIPPLTEETPQFKNIFISNVICRNANKAAFIQGLPELAIQQIEIKRIYISAKEGLIAMDADQMKLEDVTILPQTGPALSLYNCRNMNIKDVLLQPQDTTLVFISGSKTKRIIFQGYHLDALKNRIKIDESLTKAIFFQK